MQRGQKASFISRLISLCSLRSLRLNGLSLFCFLFLVAKAPAQPIEQWSIFELTLHGPTNGNPFLDVRFSAKFFQDDASFETAGFYDGDGIYHVRFMPQRNGLWHYLTSSSRAELDAKTGEFAVTPATGKNHGPVHVAHTFHFAYADGTPYKELGTTCYVWQHQPETLQEQTLKTLAASPFNKIRFCVFPKHYDWNTNEPLLYPFEGTPPRAWDTTRFNPKFFQHLEKRIADLRGLGIEADIILFHPYDEGHWGFDRMPPVADDRYLRYVVSRLSAFRNVWWSLANEYDFTTAGSSLITPDPGSRTPAFKTAPRLKTQGGLSCIATPIASPSCSTRSSTRATYPSVGEISQLKNWSSASGKGPSRAPTWATAKLTSIRRTFSGGRKAESCADKVRRAWHSCGKCSRTARRKASTR
jgi:hypothetical protein